MITIGEFVDYLAPGLLSRGVPTWPPDVFAVTASILKRTGAYTRVVELDAQGALLGGNWPSTASQVGKAWRDSFAPRSTPNAPTDVRNWWQTLTEAALHPLQEAAWSDAACTALLKLMGAADEACVGIGVTRAARDPFLRLAEARLALPRNAWSSLCHQAHPDKVRVLPKQHTPARGLTLRSLSHHLSLHPANDVRIAWRSPVALDIDQDRERLNLLLLPWPVSVRPQDFKVVDPRAASGPAMPERYRFFQYSRGRDHADPAAFADRLGAALARAAQEAGPVDAIVLPELALSPGEYEQAEQIALEHGVLLVAGVDGPIEATAGTPVPQNVCAVQWGGLTAARASSGRMPTPTQPAGAEGALSGGGSAVRTRIAQAKHHRWCLDRSQILQYGLGGVLPASCDCWERTDIGERAVNFVTLGNWLTLSVLICEDLARQDPVADILRSVGPNLVIALLMDGPQLSSRWGARYASVLAEDPGSSVLTLTSLGMARRSRPPQRDAPDRSGVIGLWRDAKYGERELELLPGCDAGLLSLTGESLDEFAADGRRNSRAAFFPVFAGFHPFALGV